jgi:hypothetical protein
MSLGGWVETDFTPRTHFLFSALAASAGLAPYLTQRVLMLTNSRMPTAESSRP